MKDNYNLDRQRNMSIIFKNIILCLAITVFIFINFIVGYIKLSNLFIILMILIGWGSSIMLGIRIQPKINFRKKIFIALIAVIVEVMIIFCSGFIFESGYILKNKMESLVEINRFINLYYAFGFIVIQELITYFLVSVGILEKYS